MSNTETELAPQEQAFLDFLFDGEEFRTPDEAKTMAGYPADYPWLKIVRKCNKQIIDKYDDFLAVYAHLGVQGLLQIVETPETPGNAVKLKAITELLNRAGVTTKEKKETVATAPSHVFILPSKTEIKED